jgi:hypothetical protein
MKYKSIKYKSVFYYILQVVVGSVLLILGPLLFIIHFAFRIYRLVNGGYAAAAAAANFPCPQSITGFTNRCVMVRFSLHLPPRQRRVRRRRRRRRQLHTPLIDPMIFTNRRASASHPRRRRDPLYESHHPKQGTRAAECRTLVPVRHDE